MTSSPTPINTDTLYWLAGLFGIIAIIIATITSFLIIRTIIRTNIQPVITDLAHKEEEIVFIGYSKNLAHPSKKWSDYYTTTLVVNTSRLNTQRNRATKNTVVSYEVNEPYNFALCEN